MLCIWECKFIDNCIDIDNGKTDITGYGCSNPLYSLYPENCGALDDDDFTAKTMCCACKRK